MTGWLIAWLWQGTALVLGISAALRLLPRVNAATRYLIWWGAVGVLAWLGWSSSPHAAPLAPVLAGATAGPIAALSLFEVAPLPEWLMTSILMLWATVALFKLLRIPSGLNALHQLKDACGPVLQTLEMQLPMWLDEKGRGRPVRLMMCNRLTNAAVLGLHQPCIAFPSRLLGMVNADELDQIVLHEYGHVQRWDDWTRLAQALFEAALWMHPAARWIASELNLEREVACDDWVISKTRAARAYAGCLSRVAERNQARVSPALVPALFRKTPDVLLRVDRLLNPKRNANRRMSFAAAAAGVCIIMASAVHLRALPLVGEISAVLAIPDVPRLTRAVFAGPIVSAQSFPSASSRPDSGPLVVDLPRAQPRSEPDAPAPLVVVPLLAERTVTAMPAPVVETPSIDSRSFQGAHVPPSVTARERTSPPPAPAAAWDLGTVIGKATKKASVAVAGSVAKASVSIAKSF
ncbi:MAG: M56 family metallopeptidase [Vicinamibacterales bacterium]|nr:M56 family metallopeptidase [Vicinamibacterales bacterium]